MGCTPNSSHAGEMHALSVTSEIWFPMFVNDIKTPRWRDTCGALSRECDEYWASQHPEAAMLFGLFYSMTVNMNIGLKRVFTPPHRDSKNLSLGLCVVFVYGE